MYSMYRSVRHVGRAWQRYASRRFFTSSVHADNHEKEKAGSCWTRLRAAIYAEPSHLRDFQRFGYTVIDNAFDDDAANGLLAELKLLDEEQLLMPNHTHLAQIFNGTRHFVQKKGILEMDGHVNGIDTVIPIAHQLLTDKSFLNALNDCWSADAVSKLASSGRNTSTVSLTSQTLKLQVNEGNGACFPCHLDGDRNCKDENRLITAILYLNPHWKEQDGGSLRVYPVPYKYQDIEPVFNRLVLFSSCRLLHRVLPSFAKRYCLTIWMSGLRNLLNETSTPNLNRFAMQSPSNQQISLALRTLFSERVYPHFVRLLYASEWSNSLQESHDPSQVEAMALFSQHERQVHQIRSSLSVLLNSLPPELVSNLTSFPMPNCIQDHAKFEHVAYDDIDWTELQHFP